MRNEVIRSLQEVVKTRGQAPNYILFLNGISFDDPIFTSAHCLDIFFCCEDIKELLYQTFLNDADIVSGLDFDRVGMFLSHV
jgi:hypothetical protein